MMAGKWLETPSNVRWGVRDAQPNATPNISYKERDNAVRYARENAAPGYHQIVVKMTYEDEETFDGS